MRCEEEEPCGMRRSDAGSLEPSAGRRAGTRVRCTCSSPECSACAQSSACSLCALVQLGSSRRARMCPRAQRDEGKRTSGLMLNVVSLVRMFSKHGTTDSSSFANSHLHGQHTRAQGVHTSSGPKGHGTCTVGVRLRGHARVRMHARAVEIMVSASAPLGLVAIRCLRIVDCALPLGAHFCRAHWPEGQRNPHRHGTEDPAERRQPGGHQAARHAPG